MPTNSDFLRSGQFLHLVTIIILLELCHSLMPKTKDCSKLTVLSRSSTFKKVRIINMVLANVTCENTSFFITIEKDTILTADLSEAANTFVPGSKVDNFTTVEDALKLLERLNSVSAVFVAMSLFESDPTRLVEQVKSKGGVVIVTGATGELSHSHCAGVIAVSGPLTNENLEKLFTQIIDGRL